MRRLFVLGFFAAVMGPGCVTLRASNPADVNGDGIVNMEDIAVVCDNWLWQAPDPCEFALIPGGTFQMGDSFNEGYERERPVHKVTVDAFYMGRYEITNQQYCDFLNSAKSQGLITVTNGVVYKAGSGTNYLYCDTSASASSQYSQIAYSGGTFTVRTKSGRGMVNDPMVMVSWYGAVAYCNWRSQQEGKQLCYNLSTWVCDFSRNGYHLPSEAQWEYAARGGLSGRRFPWGNTINHNYANYEANGSRYAYDTSPYTTWTCHPQWNDGIYPYTSPVGSFSPNGYGLYDMTGNVWEWCNDWHDGNYYEISPSQNPPGPASGTYRVLRGGGWYCYACYCRVAYRHGDTPDVRISSIGFRLVLDLE